MTLPKAQVVARAIAELEPELRRFIRGRAHPNDVEDVLQLAAMRAIERSESLADPARVRAWLFRIYRNVAIDVVRRGARRRLTFESVANLPERPEPVAAESCGCSISQSRHLSPNYATVLELVDTNGLALGDAAAQLGISVNNVTVRLHRARKALRERMLEHCGVRSLADCIDCLCNDLGCCAD